MIVFEYYKLDGAEFISHLDMLRHIGKTLYRAKIPVALSQGFHPHRQIFLSPPIFVGLKTKSEYCLVDTTEEAESFMEKFNAFSPRGIKCVKAFKVEKKHKVAAIINQAEYEIEGVNYFDVNEILNSQILEIEIKGEKKNVRSKILNLRFNEDNRLIATLSFGNDVLRADVFTNYLISRYGGKITNLIKTKAFIDGVLASEVFNKD